MKFTKQTVEITMVAPNGDTIKYPVAALVLNGWAIHRPCYVSVETNEPFTVNKSWTITQMGVSKKTYHYQRQDKCRKLVEMLVTAGLDGYDKTPSADYIARAKEVFYRNDLSGL